MKYREKVKKPSVDSLFFCKECKKHIDDEAVLDHYWANHPEVMKALIRNAWTEKKKQRKLSAYFTVEVPGSEPGSSVDILKWPEKRYGLILVDPPWGYKNKKTGGSMKSGAAQKYKTMTLEEIMALDVPGISEKNSVLFLWVPTPLKEYGDKVIEAWGFKYKTKIYWRKIMNLGMGYYYRGQVEECWVCIRGKVTAWRSQLPNVIETQAREHSRKPDEIYQYCEETNMTPRIELFARQAVNGWDRWGLETDKFEKLIRLDDFK